jgi:hypothetical protein
LLCHLKNPPISSNVSSPVIEELPPTETPLVIDNSNDISQPTPMPLPGSDRQTRGFRVHIEPKTHTVTRTNKKQKVTNTNDIPIIDIKQEPVEVNHITPEVSSSTPSTTTTVVSIKGFIQKLI